jgi:hypothetical protein
MLFLLFPHFPHFASSLFHRPCAIHYLGGKAMVEASQPIDWHHIWLIVKSFFEFIYFLTGIGILIAAFKAVGQVRIASEQLDATRQFAKENAKREAVRLAGDHCRYFAETVVPAWSQADVAYAASHCTFLDPVRVQGRGPQQPAFVIANGDFAPQVNYDMNRITDEC